MSSEVSNQITKKKSLFNRWRFWRLSILVVITLISSLSSCSSTDYELSKMATMNRQQIIEKFGKPDEIISDDTDDFNYGYNAGFKVSGNSNGATSIILLSDMVKEKSSNTYKIFDIHLQSSFEESKKKLGKPNLSGTKDGKKIVAYLTEEDYILVFSTAYNSDKIEGIELATYDQSTINQGLDITNILGSTVSENEIKSIYEIKDKSSTLKETTYIIEGFIIIVDNQNSIVKKLVLSQDATYNINGIRIGDSIDKANKMFGNPISSSEGVKNTTQYSYKYNNIGNTTNVTLSIDNDSKKIGYIEVSLN